MIRPNYISWLALVNSKKGKAKPANRALAINTLNHPFLSHFSVSFRIGFIIVTKYFF